MGDWNVPCVCVWIVSSLFPCSLMELVIGTREKMITLWCGKRGNVVRHDNDTRVTYFIFRLRCHSSLSWQWIIREETVFRYRRGSDVSCLTKSTDAHSRSRWVRTRFAWLMSRKLTKPVYLHWYYWNRYNSHLLNSHEGTDESTLSDVAAYQQALCFDFIRLVRAKKLIRYPTFPTAYPVTLTPWSRDRMTTLAAMVIRSPIICGCFGS